MGGVSILYFGATLRHFVLVLYLSGQIGQLIAYNNFLRMLYEWVDLHTGRASDEQWSNYQS